VTDSGPTILLIEDEAQMLRFLRASLSSNGYRVFEAETGEAGIAAVASRNPDLILLDLGLPDIDGLVVTERLRSWSKAPIIVISARGREEDKINALDAGADDYLTKPFGVGELLARIRVGLRNAARGESSGSLFSVGELKVDLVKRQVLVGEQEVHLTPIEYKLLSTLVKYAGRVITHQQLLKEVWGPGSRDQTQYLRVYMGQLRHKLEKNPSRPQFLITEAGVGYRLRTQD
jgi:two-component system KDP operon response regulator KdpE